MTKQKTPEQPGFDEAGFIKAKEVEATTALGRRARIIGRGLASLNDVEPGHVPEEDGTHIEVQGVPGEPDEHPVDVRFDTDPEPE